jgi:hypothetical protein
MKYYKIHRSYEPSIIGLNDASAQVEIINKKTKHSFENEDERLYFNNFINKNRKDTNRVTMNSFAVVDTSKISFINAHKTKKRIKEVDIMYYMPREAGFDIVFSKKILEFIEKYKLSDYNKVNLKIEGFNTEYYLIGFPLIKIEEIDFKKSLFYDSFAKKEFVFNNYEDYENHTGFVEAKNIILQQKFEYDVLKVPFGIFFSEKLVSDIEKIDLKALEIYENIILEC